MKFSHSTIYVLENLHQKIGEINAFGMILDT